ncbi:5' nucleotidase, NT5C type [Acinetobacter sp.]|uniref:5' nucleotidase, NT5C type n=1 Tax=Acinetobacter sp. TaxID=472 RepID=UPI003D0697BA
MKIIMDVDGVLRNIVDQVLEINRLVFDPGSTASHDDINVWNIKKVLTKLPPLNVLFHEHAKEIFENAQPYPLALESLMALKEQHEIHIVTAQEPYRFQHTINWLEKYNIKYDSITFMVNGTKNHIHGDVMIDDGMHNLDDYKAAGANKQMRLICMDQPWNQQWQGEKVYSMLEAELLINGYLRKAV